MNVVEKLLNESKDIWKLYNEHPFIKGIQDGTLDRDKFRYYIIQDYLYLEEFVKAFAIGIAKSKSVEIQKLFTKYTSVINDELNIHKGYFHELKIKQEEINATQRSIDNLSYTSYMLRIAYECGEAEILAAILPCAYSYEVIAKNILKENPDSVKNELFGNWIGGYSSDEYANGPRELINVLNSLTKNYNEKQVEELIKIFVNCSRYELLFWDMAWKMSK